MIEQTVDGWGTPIREADPAEVEAQRRRDEDRAMEIRIADRRTATLTASAPASAPEPAEYEPGTEAYILHEVGEAIAEVAGKVRQHGASRLGWGKIPQVLGDLNAATRLLNAAALRAAPLPVEERADRNEIIAKAAIEEISDLRALLGLERGESLVKAVRTLNGPRGVTHCDQCGLDWLDNGLNPLGCPYCAPPLHEGERERLRSVVYHALESWEAVHGRDTPGEMLATAADAALRAEPPLPSREERERELLGVIARDHERTMQRRVNGGVCWCAYCEDFRALAALRPALPEREVP